MSNLVGILYENGQYWKYGEVHLYLSEKSDSTLHYSNLTYSRLRQVT